MAFLHIVFVGVVSLFPPVNPIGTALIIDPFLNRLDQDSRRSVALKIAIYAFSICVFTLLVGGWLFKLFGISLPVVQVAGGFIICKMGWDLLSASGSAPADSNKGPSGAKEDAKSVENILFYPLAFPMTTGAGTISILLTLSARGQADDAWTFVTNTVGLFVASAITCVMVYFAYAYTPALLKRLGTQGGQIVDRLSAFLVFCVGLQIAIDGIRLLVQGH